MDSAASNNLTGIWVSVVLPEQQWQSWPKWLLYISQNGSILEGAAEYYGLSKFQSDCSYVLNGIVDGTMVSVELTHQVNDYKYFNLMSKKNILEGEQVEGKWNSSRVQFTPLKMARGEQEEWAISRSSLSPFYQIMQKKQGKSHHPK